MRRKKRGQPAREHLLEYQLTETGDKHRLPTVIPPEDGMSLKSCLRIQMPPEDGDEILSTYTNTVGG